MVLKSFYCLESTMLLVRVVYLIINTYYWFTIPMCKWTILLLFFLSFFFFVLHIQSHDIQNQDIQNQKQIQNSGIFRFWGTFRTLVHLDPCQTPTMKRFAKIFIGNNYFRNISFSCSLLYQINIMNFFNTCLIFTPKVYQI